MFARMMLHGFELSNVVFDRDLLKKPQFFFIRESP